MSRKGQRGCNDHMTEQETKWSKVLSRVLRNCYDIFPGEVEDGHFVPMRSLLAKLRDWEEQHVEQIVRVSKTHTGTARFEIVEKRGITLVRAAYKVRAADDNVTQVMPSVAAPPHSFFSSSSHGIHQLLPTAIPCTGLASWPPSVLSYHYPAPSMLSYYPPPFLGMHADADTVRRSSMVSQTSTNDDQLFAHQGSALSTPPRAAPKARPPRLPAQASVQEARESRIVGHGQRTQSDAETLTCIVCYDRPRECICDPCRHIALCWTCSERIQDRRCPVCRTQVDSFVTVHIA
eukprot:TRINITY_DN91435_c0_g1_i1.p1 TRINITY_DN91435_c0_g1~~TRINITY_DN91435_c0_g1_i1.p1  ORF type:complete len:291 (-),score=11.51 TRINITY_DN91435_c0_g1_i1:6-878(-)